MNEGESRVGLRRHWKALLPVAAMLMVMTGLVVYAPTLYTMFCNLTGYGGTVQRAAEPDTPQIVSAEEPDTAPPREIRVLFDANVAPGLPWTFRPEQRSVTVKLGDSARAYYVAENNSDETVVARATFNVTPYKAAPYFFKIECFCFTEERLGPGESARMPLELFVDEHMAADKNLDDVHEMTLSYTFFRQTGLSEEEIAAARDLAGESKRLDQDLGAGSEIEFENDAPRR